ncbi:MAG: hypothetical protein OJF49_000562 [Ktedonobacterales bacterium]|jgi:hypothetical protein|nr:MAG: hypothetical protein OJF49_000562 [Ktedonobacterales bacterium]
MVTLEATTGNKRADSALRGLIGIYEVAFPGRIHGCYVEGSHADGTGLDTSDLDLELVFKERFASDVECEAANRLGSACADLSCVELDVSVVDEAGLAGGAHPLFKLASVLVYGEDIRDRVPLISIEAWTRNRMHAAYWLMNVVLGRPAPVRRPLMYPDPEDEFRGYVQRMVRLPDGREARSTRDLIRTTGWAATALIALRARQYVARKRDCHQLYRRYIGGEHADLLEDIYIYCRQHWLYLVPDARAEREQLLAICERALAFENDFLNTYHTYALAELRSTEEAARNAACTMLGRLPFDDAEVMEEVRRAAGVGTAASTVDAG